MPDISMCSGEGCPLATKCYRFLARPSMYQQSYFLKPPFQEGTQSCEYFWKAEKGDVKRGTQKVKDQLERRVQ